jgi:hypothetical protein
VRAPVGEDERQATRDAQRRERDDERVGDPAVHEDGAVDEADGEARADHGALARRELAADSENVAAKEFLGYALVRSGRGAEGLGYFRQVYAARPLDANLAELAVAYVWAGDTARARALLPELRARARPSGYSMTLDFVYAALGEADSAFAWLERKYVDRAPNMIELEQDWAYNSIRRDPRFLDLLRRIGLRPWRPR